MTLQTTLKYVIITLSADNHGEGGIFALYALVKRTKVKWLIVPAIVGGSALLADGIITPPISVSSAIEGLGMVKGLEKIIVPGNTLTIGIVVAILSLLFFFQRFGTHVIGKFFGPIMAAWFTMLLVIGVNEILIHPDIIKALNPYYGYNLLLNYPNGFWLLGAVFLCTTGAEALYSDLGHCGIKNIRITWIYVKISLVVCYLGQAAWLMHQGENFLNGRNPFFEIIPTWFLLPSIIIATCATIIASQALISGSFTLISEGMNLNFWPRVTVKQPSDSKGQVYIPSVNSMLWFGCILMMVYFKESAHMEAAYGFSITITMLMTTYLLSYFIKYRLKWNKLKVIVFLSIFGTIEIAFFIANVAKIKERWMFLFFELFIFTVMYVWFFARKINNRFTKFVELGKYSSTLTELSEDDAIPKFATHLIYLSKADRRHEIEEKIMKSIFAKKPKRADVYWFLHLNRTEEPFTLSYDVSELVDDKVMRVDFKLGFRIQPRVNVLFKKVMQELNECQELGIYSKYESLKQKDFHADITYVIIESFFSIENELSFKEDFIMDLYFNIKNFAQSDQKAFGLDNDMTIVEHVPLLIKANENLPLKRIYD